MNLYPVKGCTGGHGFGRPKLLFWLLLALSVGLASLGAPAFAAGVSRQECALILWSVENEVGKCSEVDESLGAPLKPFGTGTFKFYTALLDLSHFSFDGYAKEVKNLVRLESSLKKGNSAFLLSKTLAAALQLLPDSGEDRLPPGSFVLYEEPSASEIHLWQVLCLLLLVAAVAALITFLIFQQVKRKRAEAEIKDRLRFETLLAELSSRFVRVPVEQIDEEVSCALQRVCETLDLEMGTLWQQQASAPGHITLTHAYGPAGVPAVLKRLNCEDLFPWCSRRVKDGEVVAVSSIEELPPEAARDRESWHQFGIKSSLTFGLAVGGSSIVGALSFHSLQAERAWTEPLVKHLEVVAQMFSNALALLDAERALRASEERFRGLVENATVGIYRTTPDGRILAANPTLVKLLGHADFESLATRNLEQEGFEPTYLRKEFKERVEREGQVIGLEAAWRKQDGSMIFVRESARAIRSRDGEILYYDGIVEDITERKRAEDALFEIEERFRLLSESSLTGIYLFQEDLYRYVNPAMAGMFGYVVEEVVDRLGPLDLAYPDDRPMVEENVRRRLEGKVEEVRYEFRGLRKDGSVFPVEVHGRRIEHAGKIGVIGTLIENTERKRGEQSLRELGRRLLMAQELERRHVARELHDDFSQRLALLAIDLQKLAQRPPVRKHKLHARLQAMWAQTQELTADIHRLSRQLHPSRLEELGLVKAVRSYCRELSRQAGLDVQFFSADVPRDLPKEISLCIYRIVQEALGNIVKHSGVKTAEVELGGAPDEVQLVVSDLGKGFAMKDAQEGKGLGLVSMQERVRYVGGSWSIEARPSGGTRVAVRIPVPSQQPEKETAQRSVAVGFAEPWSKDRSRTRVLLADDHTLLLEAFKGFLEPEFEVVGTVADGRAALAAVEELKPELVILDIAMPLLNGLEAARRIRATSPNVKVIFLTMNPDPEVAREAMALGASGYLLKTSAASELRKAIREAIRGLKYVTPGIRRSQAKLFIDESLAKESSQF